MLVSKFNREASISGKKHIINLPAHTNPKAAKIQESTPSGTVPALFYDVYNRDSKDLSTFYGAFLCKVETERQDRLAKEEAEKKDHHEMKEFLRARIAELQAEKQELKEDIKRFFGVLEENKLLKGRLEDSQASLDRSEDKLREVELEFTQHKGFYREMEKDFRRVKKERDMLHSKLSKYEDCPLGIRWSVVNGIDDDDD
jgi:hypothetical protein